MDITRDEIEQREEGSLADFALRSRDAARARPIPRDGRAFDYRTEYQRDRDRILHARAFRRLRLKGEARGAAGAERRDRLTLTLEVTQIARTIARALALNEDLTEAIALGHALGTPPFGRDGETALDAVCRESRVSSIGGFDAGAQALRVVDLLEKRYEHPGLNLTHDVREGLLKLRPAEPIPATPGSIGDGLDVAALEPRRPPSPEAQAVRSASRIAATMGDLDDALRGGDLPVEEAESLPIVRELIRHLGDRYPAGSRRRFMKANAIHRGLTHLLVTGTIHSAKKALRGWARAEGVVDHAAYLASRHRLPPRIVELAPRTLGLFESLRAALGARVGSSSAAAAARRRARLGIESLVAAYRDDPRLLDDYVLIRFKEIAGGPYLRDVPPAAVETESARRYHGSGVFFRLIVDHVAGMTDSYALQEIHRIDGTALSTGGLPPPA
ncbi:MAG: HD domain-containing protein [Acidobacteria bacterium]|nr:HD domain-containing protein [Acidobacteriota bacterium]